MERLYCLSNLCKYLYSHLTLHSRSLESSVTPLCKPQVLKAHSPTGVLMYVYSFVIVQLFWFTFVMLWDVTLCHWVTGPQCFEVQYCRHYQCLTGPWRMPFKFWEPSVKQHSVTTLKMAILKLFFMHLKNFPIARCWSDWYCIAGIRNCSSCAGHCC